MWCKPTEKQLERLPKLYETENISLKDKIIHMHFFVGNCDWYACEYDPQNKNFFGFAILNGDYQMAEWGYFNFKELCELRTSHFLEVERDKYWKPKPAYKIEKICKAQNWMCENVVG